VIEILSQVRPSPLIDVLIVTVMLWVALTWLKNTRARLAIPGMAFLGVLYLLAQRMQLQLTTWIFQGFFAVFVLVIVVVFQEDLRRLLESITVWSFRREAPSPSRTALDLIVRVCARFAQDRVGALLILPGRTPLERHLQGGTALDGRVSEELLQSIFDPRTPGHDGAILLNGDRVERFGIHLPLSTDWNAIGQGGTRHAAALGLAERSDALCIAISEERGTISIARNGNLLELPQAETLHRELSSFLSYARPHSGRKGVSGLHQRIFSQWREGLFAVALASIIWFVSVPGMSLTQMDRTVPVIVDNLPEGYTLISMEPEEIEITFEGRRRDFLLASSNQFEIHIDALLVQLGRRTFQVTPDIVTHPDNLRFVGSAPDKIRFNIEKSEGEEKP
jgi:diadenylate cyclase